MHVQRAMLPGSATIVVVKSLRCILIDFSLSRDGAALAIQGVMPSVHTDVVDHWVDTAFPRPSTSYKLITRVGTAALASMSLMSVPVMAHAAHGPVRVDNPAPYADVILPSSTEGVIMAPGDSGDSALEVAAETVVAQVEALIVPAAYRPASAGVGHVEAAGAAEVEAASFEHGHAAKAHGKPWFGMGEQPVQAFGKADRGGMNRHTPLKV